MHPLLAMCHQNSPSSSCHSLLATIFRQQQQQQQQPNPQRQQFFSRRTSDLYRATNSWLCSTIILGCCLLAGCDAIKINQFQVPEAVEKGKSATLYCDYTLENSEELYSIKFYKQNVEFYRFIPGERQPKQSYKLKGIYVDNSDGLYICEISTEGPIFSTVRSEQLMKIYVLPNESIQIHGVLDRYNYGDNISLVCKSASSWPPVKLEWYINNILVDANYSYNIKQERTQSDLVVSKLGLNIYAKQSYFKRGILEIKCVATLTIVYEYDAVEHLVTGSFKNKSAGQVSIFREWSLQPNIKTPIINGMKKNYLLNDILKLNCSTSIKNAKLKWFILNKEANQSHLIRYDSYNGKHLPVLGLWLRMEKRLVQMPDLRLRCLSYFPKQIAQFNSKLQIRTYDNQIWELQSSALKLGIHSKLGYLRLLFIVILLYLIVN